MIKDYRFSVKIKSESKWNLHSHLTCAKLLIKSEYFMTRNNLEDLSRMLTSDK